MTRSRFKLISLFALLSFIIEIKADTTCTTGYFLKDGKVCQPCRPGYYCTGGTLSYMKKCSPGFYTNYGASSCTQCPVGFYCSTPTVPPIACPVFQYSVAGSSKCSICPSGSVCGPNGVITQCNPGEICRSDESTVKEPCPRGHKCPFPDQPTLIIQCPAGTYSAENSTSCTLCLPGYSCPLGSSTPYKCLSGTYASAPGMSSCTKCPKGYYCDSISLSPIRCDLGQYSPEQAAACIDCPAGFQCPDQEITAPVICTKGFYSLSKSSFCIACPEDYECQDRKSFTKCADGFYSLNTMDTCLQCPSGYECGSWGKPMPCSPGQYSNPGQKTCTYCPKGSYCPSTKQLPAQCQLGYYQDEFGKSYCKTCPDGFTCTVLSSSPVDCGSGYYTDKYHQQCYQCPAGYDCSTRKYEDRFFCGKGQYSPASQVVCLNCPAGYYCERPDIDQQECPDGTYSIEGQVTCTECPLGYNCLDKKGKYIVKCLEGQYISSVTKTCTDCPAGYACPAGAAQVGYDVKIACSGGTYSIGGQTQCTVCSPGKYCIDTTKATETACATGYLSFGGATECIKCPANYECPTQSSLALCPTYFYSAEGSNICIPCPDGMNCIYPNATLALSMCSPGYYMNTLDWTCQICPYGFYCPENSFEPQYCSSGNYSDRMGSSECKQCPIGYFSQTGSEFCQPTPPGSASPLGVQIICAEGTYSDWGFSYCKTCEPGFLCPAGGTIGMHYSCPKGSYCIDGVQIKCKQGYFGIAERASTESNGCAICPAGYFCLGGTDNFELNPCPRGHYCPVMTGLPNECPQGTYNDLLYKKTIADCQLCPMGHQCDNATSDQGDICQEGYYCTLGSYSGQHPCPAGTFGGYRTGLKDVSECQICPAGYYCPAGTANPIASQPGNYQPYSSIGDEEAINICPPKFYCPNEAMTNYKGYHCTPGYYCPAGSTSSTQMPCPEGTFSDSHEIFDYSQCLNCPRGFKCGLASTSTSIVKITDCPRNQYCPLRTEASKSYLCIAGTYAPYLNSKSLDDCITCPYGNYCLSGQDAVTCPKGYFCPNGTQYSTQYPCPAGSYVDYTGANILGECKPCGVGNYCPEGSALSTPCQAGYYNDFSNEAEECLKCDQGRYCPLTGTTSQPKCPIGKYSDIGSLQCTYCEVGHYCPNAGTTIAEKESQICQAGVLCLRTLTAFSDVDSVTGLTTKITGNYGLDVYPNLRDHYCHLGYYCPAGTQSMVACPVGTYNRLKGRKSLLDCQNVEGGYYVDVEGASNWTGLCAPGYYCPDGSTSNSQIKCPIGTYRSIDKGSQPKDCSICPTGSYCNLEGMSTPTICPQGFYCPLGTVVPGPCPEGTYGALTGLADSKSCSSCPSGYYCPKKNMTIYVDQCDEGYYCIKGSKRPEPTDNVTGAICPAGGYCTVGVTVPQNCPAGTFNMFDGGESSTSCSNCWPGYYCKGSNLPKPTAKCPAGYYCLQKASEYTTHIAAAGYYSIAGSSQQFKCGRGTYNSIPKQGSCLFCQAGYYCPTMAMTAEIECPVGHYCPSYDYFVENSLYYDKIRCPVGTYNALPSQKNATSCLPCPAGQYCGSEGLFNYTGSCSAGFFCNQYAETPNPSTLQKYGYYGPCPQGYYCASGSTTPTACPIGTFSSKLFLLFNLIFSDLTQAKDASVCLPCIQGYYCDVEGLITPIKLCDVGFYCEEGSKISQPQGKQCDEGQYCPLGSASPKICPVGFYQPSPAQGKCLVCPKGYYCVFSQKKPCPPGYICS